MNPKAATGAWPRARPLRIAVDMSILRHPHGGTARYANEVVRELSDSTRYDATVRTTAGLPRLQRGHRVLRVLNAVSDYGWLAFGSAVSAARLKADVWYSPANTISPALRVPAVVTIHDVNFLIMPEAYDRAYRLWAKRAFSVAARHASRIVTDSHYSAAQLNQLLAIPNDRISVAYPGIDHVSRLPEIGDRRQRPSRYALFVGQTEPHKNVGLLLNAFRLEVPKDLTLLVAGSPGRDDERLRELALAPDLRNRVRFLGRVPDFELADLYRNATCFLFPSKVEGFGLPPLEAMAYGIPTAVAATSSLPEVTGNGAAHFDPDDAWALSLLINRLADDDEMRSCLSLQGRQRAAKFRWRETAAIVWDSLTAAHA